MTTGKRIKALRKALKITQAELGLKIGVSGVTVGNWEKDEHLPKGEHLVALAKSLNTFTDYIITGKYSDKPKNKSDIEEIAPTDYIPTKKVPLISSIQAGSWMEIVDIFEPGHADQWQETTANVSKNSFALRVEGKSMQNPNGYPTVPHGAIVIVDPDLAATSGKIVVAKLPNSNEATIKKLVIDGPIKYLEPLNPDYKPITIDSECVIIGVVKQVIQDI